jgi:hypothetical protein
MRLFHLGDILSITTDVLVSPRHIDGVYDILGYMTGDTLWTHQLPRASKECAPWLLRQHPQLMDISSDGIGPDNWREWLDGLVATYGEELNVEPIPKDDHVHKHPAEEAVEMMGKDRVIVIGEDGT